MLDVLAEGVLLLARLVALEAQGHEDLLKDLVLLVEYVNFIAQRTLVFAIGHILASHFREIFQALLAAKCLAVPAL